MLVTFSTNSHKQAADCIGGAAESLCGFPASVAPPAGAAALWWPASTSRPPSWAALGVRIH